MPSPYVSNSYPGNFLATLRGGLKDGPVRQGKKSGPAEGLQGRSVRGRVGQWQDGPVRERQLHYAHTRTSQTADHINRQLVKQQRRYLFKA